MENTKDLQLLISEYENQFAEALAADANIVVLKFICRVIRQLKEQLNTNLAPAQA